MKLIVFDIWGDYGHFKKIYTTTSPLSYDFPPKTSIYGILGAFLGLDKEDYLKHINKNTVKIALRIKNPIQKTNIALNLIDTKKGRVKGPGFNLINGRTQIRFEMLKNPKYRLYVHLTDEGLYSKLKKLLEQHKTVYIISLGLSELIANFEYIGEFEVEKKVSYNEYTLINSLIRRDNIINDDINLEIDREYLFSKIPNEMDENRITTEYIDIFYERNGEPISCKVKEYYPIPELKENITFI
ncbi:MAG: CRISPR-associated protein Cas5h [Methanothermococcus sp.]|jgi:CRISPR-associated protein Cas5h|uniref:type I-B CRISPR-associated protein Cas5b n=1 Tax=Methanothermococcus TaxID=155862 RepID=UPI000360C001|nr:MULTISPECIES: type I-B CRISPR-associated protein Cas5b [Methanothermococcus]MDK2790911.1 CRISPR-associated protein Cas5h [Methanothermococcus sp.]MDK2978870.1 CRISPR-associated protein Cas5h [Bacteroidales bacterium]MDK2988433.1 CRISPR-associated protein Cas5h [Methanothermococcus sp.]